VLFLWAIVLTWHPALFDTAPSYSAMADLFSQNTWAIICLIVGGGRLTVLAINGAWRRSPHMRAASAFLSCFVWYQISIGLLQAETGGTGLAVYPVLLCLDAFNAIRAFGEAGKSDAIHQRVANHGSDN
jgi:hypothetical protein